jgi:two-component system, LytTR family, response regulator
MSERPLKVLVADDELMARQRLVRMLSELGDVEVVAVCSSGEDALAQLDVVDVDLALLDIQMPGLSGLEVSEATAEWGIEVVFTTAHPEHALLAFERGVVDYLLKPIEKGRLMVALERARQRVPANESAPQLVVTPERLALTVCGEVRLLAPADISHAVLDGELVRVYAGAESLFSDLSLNELERRLPRGRFVRVHRRALVNLEHVVRLIPQPTGGYRAITRGGHEVPVSRQSARALRRQLGIDH